ncbi:ABC transporter permease [Planotetraspora sp. GP83]|uniref:ABC transporter permease n=1 Tax=Planotetraspora sp. GP83 TaxID=3156264 RepID=UPI0035176AF9
MIARLTLKNLGAHKLRLALTALAVILGTAFVAGTLIFSSTTNKAFDELFSEGARTIDVMVQAKQAFAGDDADTSAKPIPASVLDQVRKVEGVAEARGHVMGFAAIVGRDGKVVGGKGPPQFGVDWFGSLSEYALTTGRAPAAPGEVAIDSVTAGKTGYRAGDRVKVVVKGPAEPYTVVGIFKVGRSGITGGATYAAFDQATAQRLLLKPRAFSGIVAKAAGGVSQAELAKRVGAVVPAGYEAITAQKAADDAASDVKEFLGFLNTFLLTFGIISIFVGSFIIFNTFSMLVAQRTRELALLRAVGASRRQVTRSVMGEALGVGLFGSFAGLLAGAGLAIGLRVLFKAMGADLPTTGLVIAPGTVVWTFAVGVVVTLFAAYLPARRAAKIPPVAALRDDVAMPVRSLRYRAVTGGLFALAGGAVLAAGLAGGGNPVALVGAGAVLVFLAISMLSPLFARPVTRVLGAPFARLSGAAGKLSSQNAQRNPRRTSATAAALMIGMALIATVSVLASSMTASIDKALDSGLGADFQVSSGGGFGPPQSFDPSVAAGLAAVPGVESATPMKYTQIKLKDETTLVTVADPARLAKPFKIELESGALAAGTDEILVDAKTAKANSWKAGTAVPGQYADGATASIRVAGIYKDNPMAGSYLLGEGTYAAHYPSAQVSSVLIVKRPSADAATVKKALDGFLTAYPNLTLQDQSDMKEQARGSVNQLLTMITALLVLSIVIAILGIINTLALSVVERTREIGLLRAIGMGRRQLRAMIRYESVVISVFGALLGVAVGVGVGWAVQAALAGEGIDVLAIPGGRLAGYLVAAGLVGVLAAIWPARRAARMDVLRAIATQ